jgi:glycosyltransferase involved in cell wall biosynthesis
VDDGSTDGTRTVAEKLVAGQQGQKPLIKYIRQANQGPAVARNTGIKNATGDYIAFLDADDRWLPARLKKQMSVLRGRPDVGLVCSGRIRVDETTGRKVIDCAGAKLSDDSYRDLWTRGNYVVTSTVLARKQCFQEVGGFDEDPRVLGCEDAEMWLRIAGRFAIAYVNEPLVEYLVRQGGMNRSNIQRSYESAIFAIQKHETEFRARYADAGSIIRQRWGCIYYHWGLSLFDAGQFALAKEKFWKALTLHKYSWPMINFYLLTLLGSPLLGTLKQCKKRLSDIGNKRGIA